MFDRYDRLAVASGAQRRSDIPALQQQGAVGTSAGNLCGVTAWMAQNVSPSREGKAAIWHACARKALSEGPGRLDEHDSDVGSEAAQALGQTDVERLCAAHPTTP